MYQQTLKERLRNARGSSSLLEDNINNKLDKIKKDFERSHRDLTSLNQNPGNITEKERETLRTIKNVPSGLSHIGKMANEANFLSERSHATPIRELSPQENEDAAQKTKSMLTHRMNPSFVAKKRKQRGPATLAQVLGSPGSPRSPSNVHSPVQSGNKLKYTLSPTSSQIEAGVSEQVAEGQITFNNHPVVRALQANKVPNKNRLGATGETPDDSKQMKLADKHRNVIMGVGKPIKSVSYLSPDKSQDAHKKKATRVFGVEQQLYKDVDSDHQQKMLNSNIYIPDYDSGRDDTHHSTDNLTGLQQQHSNLLDPNVKSSAQLGGSMKADDELYQRLYDRYQTSTVSEKRDLNILPQIFKKRNMDNKFNSHFKRRHLSVADTKLKQAKRSFAQSSPRGNKGPIKANKLVFASQLDHIGKSGDTIDPITNVYVSSEAKNLLRDESEALPIQYKQSYAKLSGKISSEKPIAQLNKKSYHLRSQSVVHQSKKYLNINKPSLKDQTLINSQSRVLQMLSKSTLNNAQDQDKHGGSFDSSMIHPSAANLGPQTQKGGSDLQLFNEEFKTIQTTDTKRNRKYKSEAKKKVQEAEERIDPSKIVLEMDLIDKDALEAEAASIQQSSVAQMKNRDPDALDANDKIEMTRRQLVLNELGIEIPRNPGTGEINVKALFAIQISQQEKEEVEETNAYSPLKTESQSSSIIKDIKPKFPLKSHFSVKEDMTLDPAKNFYREVKKYLERKEDLSDFADMQKTEQQFLLKQGIFMRRLQNVNETLDKRFSKASTSFLDESVLLEAFDQQIKEEENVRGEWLMRLKASDFDRKWLKMKNIKDHNGVPISTSGHLMTTEWLTRQRKYKELQQNALNKRLRQIRENEDQAEYKTDLAVVKEDKENAESQENDDYDDEREDSEKGSEPESPEKPPALIKDTNRKMLDKKGSSNIDAMSVMSGQTSVVPGRQKFGDKTARSESTNFNTFGKGEQTEAQYQPTTHTKKYKNKDKELYEELLRIELQLFVSPKSEAVLGQYGIVLTTKKKGLLARINGAANRTGADQKKRFQAKLMTDIVAHVEKRVEQKRLDTRMERERREWDAEQEGIRGQELRVKMAKFLLERQQENDVLNYVIEKEANDSDEDFNVFDKLAQKVEDSAVGKKLREDFTNKLIGEKARIVTNTAEEKIPYRIDPDQLEATLAKHAEVSPPRLQFVSASRSPLERSLKDFNKQVGSNYYDDSLPLNQGPEERGDEDPLAMGIQKEIADMSQKVVLLSEDHQKAFKLYLKTCYEKQCSPLPILNRIEQGPTNALSPVLALEGYSINEKQIECLEKSLEKFGPSAFTKVYANNNGLKDLPREGFREDGSPKLSDTATFLSGIQLNKHINSLEIAFNKVTSPDSVRILSEMVQSGRLTTVSLSSVKMSVALSERLFEAMTYSTQLKELKLQNFKIEKEGAKLLGNAIRQQFALQTLDLSWNTIAPRDFNLLMGKLQSNKSLKEVSLHNMTARAVDEPVYDESGSALPATSTSIASFITENHSLLHLDLSYMALSQQDLVEICTACSKARTLLAIHLTGNGLTGAYAEVRDNPHLTAGDDDYFRRQQGRIAFRRKLRQIMRPRKRMKQFREHVEQEGTYKTSKLIESVPVLPRVEVKESEIKAKELKELEIVQDLSNLRGADYDNAELKTVKETARALEAGKNTTQVEQVGEIPAEGMTKIEERKGQPKKATGQRGGASEEIEDDRLIFTRVLGHFEMPHAHRWAEVGHCWYCENHSYHLILASKSICEKYYLRPLGKDALKFKQKILDVSERHRQVFKSNAQDEWGSDCDERYYDADAEAEEQVKLEAKGSPGGTKIETRSRKLDDYYRNCQVVGAFSNWKRRSLLPIYDFLQRLHKNGQEPVRDVALGKDTYQQQLLELKGNKTERLRRLDELRRTKTAKNLKVPQDIRDTNAPWDDKINAEDRKCGNKGVWDELIGSLPYKEHVNIVVDKNLLKRMPIFNKDISETNEKIYAYAAFLPPGKFNSCILHNCDENQQDKGMYSFLIQSKKREHAIDIKYKKIKKFKVERKFHKHQSMFAEWLEPDYKKLLENDLRRTKDMSGYSIKDYQTQQNIQDILLNNIEHILDNFYYQLGHSSALASFYPHSYGMDSLKEQCQQLYLHDEANLPIEDQTIVYTSAHQPKIPDRPSGAGKSICRFEFFEILIRIAKKKYMDKGKCQTADEALQTCIDRHFKPGMARYKHQGGMSFREKYIWTLGVDDMFKSNDDSVKKLYNFFLDPTLIDPETAKPYKELNLAQCLAIAPHLGLTETDVSTAFSFCKMVPAEEFQHYNNYKKLKLVEFRDLLVRLADCTYKKEVTMRFNDKVEGTLRALFRLIGCDLAQGQHNIDVSSESDYNSDE